MSSVLRINKFFFMTSSDGDLNFFITRLRDFLSTRRRAALGLWLAVASGASAFGGASGRGGLGVRRTQRTPPRRRALRRLPHAQLRASAARRPR